MAEQPLDDLDVTGVYVTSTLSYLRRACGDEGVARALEIAGELETDLPDDDGWISLDRVIAITDAAASLVGSPDFGRLVGEELFANNVAIGMDEVIRAYGSPVDALVGLTAYGSRIAGGWTLEVTDSGEDFVEISSESAVAPTSAFFCGLGVGYYSKVPGLFGMLDTTIIHPECLARGDSRCHYVVRWIEPSVQHAARSFDAATHFERLHDVSAQLAAAPTSTEVVQRAATLAPEVTFGRRFIVRAHSDDDQVVLAHHGFADLDAVDLALLQIEEGVPASVGEQSRCVVPLTTGRGTYGWIAAFHPPRSTIDRAVERSLAAYARNVASAFEAAVTLETAHRDRDTAHTLAAFARDLAKATTAEEVTHLTEKTLMRSSRCAEVTTWLLDESSGVLRDPATNRAMPISDRSTPWLADASQRWTTLDPEQTIRLHPIGAAVTTSVVVPLMARGEVLGCVAAGWSAGETPTANSLERLDAIVDQAALAFDVVHLLSDLQQQARHDPLTGLANRALLAERAEHALSQARRSGRHIGLLFIDLDGFKAVNDQFGHATGDDIICQVAGRLGEVVRAHDTVARLGGDEFVVLLSDCNGEQDAAAAAHRVTEVMQRPFHTGGIGLSLSASVGVVAARPDDDTWHALLDRADAAMYAHKQHGTDSATPIQAP